MIITGCEVWTFSYSPILVLVLLVDAAHESRSGGQDFIDEDEDGLLRRKLDPLADHIDKLSHRQVGGNEVLLFVDGCNIALLDLLADDLCEAGSGQQMLQVWSVTTQ
jgi:hypothetical protein